MYGVHLAVAPIANEHRLLILRRELGPGAEGHARRGTRPDVADSRQVIHVVRRVLAGAVAPAELAAAGHLAHARRPVPRRVEVVLHVGVVSEQVALRVVGRVVLIAEADAEKLPLLTVRRDVVNAPARSHHPDHEPFAVRQSRQQVILAPMRRDFGRVVLHHLRLVAADDREPLAVGVLHHRVRAVFAGAGFELAQQFDGVEVATLLRGRDLVQAGAVAVNDDVEGVEGPAQPLGHAEGFAVEFQRERSHGRLGGIFPIRRRHDEEAFVVLVAHDEPAVGQVRHRHPRALFLFRHGVEQFDLEPFGDLQLIARRRRHRFRRRFGLSLGDGGEQ